MDLTLLAEMLLRRGWLVVMLAAVGAALGLLVAVAAQPVYEAETRVAVRPRRPADLGQTQAIKESMRSYMHDIATQDMAHAVSRRLADQPQCSGFDRDPGRLLYKMLRVGTDENVYEIQVRARSSNDAEATCVSRTWAQEFVDRREQVNLQLDPLDRIVTETRDETTLHRVWPRRKLLVMVGGILGAMLGAALVLALEYLEGAVVRRRRDVAQVAGVPVLGVVPALAADSRPRDRAMRHGVREAVRRTRSWLAAAWPVLLFAALGLGGGLALSVARPTVYRARTRIAVEPARGSDWGQTQAIREIMRGFSEDIATRRMAVEVNAREELDLPPDTLLEKLNVAPDEAIYEIHVDFRDADEEVAREVSRAWAQLFVEEREIANWELDQRDRILTRLRDATTSEVWEPKTLPNALAGAVLGAIVGAAVVLAFHLIGSRQIRSGADAQRATGLDVLALIPSGQEAGSHLQGA